MSGLARGVSILYTAVSSKGSCSVVRALYRQAAALVRETRRLSTLTSLIRENNGVKLRRHACTLAARRLHSLKRLLKQWTFSAKREIVDAFKVGCVRLAPSLGHSRERIHSCWPWPFLLGKRSDMHSPSTKELSGLKGCRDRTKNDSIQIKMKITDLVTVKASIRLTKECCVCRSKDCSESPVLPSLKQASCKPQTI